MAVSKEWVTAWIDTNEGIEKRIARYEQEYGMSSEEFLEADERGDFPSMLVAFDWHLSLNYRGKGE